jgi:hypothetical protein
VRAPNLFGIIDVIAIPYLTLFFGARLLHFGASAAAKACHEENKRGYNFQAREYVFHIFSFTTKMAQRRRNSLFSLQHPNVDTSREIEIIQLITDRFTLGTRAFRLGCNPAISASPECQLRRNALTEVGLRYSGSPEPGT